MQSQPMDRILGPPRAEPLQGAKASITQSRSPPQTVGQSICRASFANSAQLPLGDHSSVMGKRVSVRRPPGVLSHQSGAGLWGQKSLSREGREDHGKQLHPRAQEGRIQPTQSPGSCSRAASRIWQVGQLGGRWYRQVSATWKQHPHLHLLCSPTGQMYTPLS